MYVTRPPYISRFASNIFRINFENLRPEFGTPSPTLTFSAVAVDSPETNMLQFEVQKSWIDNTGRHGASASQFYHDRFMILTISMISTTNLISTGSIESSSLVLKICFACVTQGARFLNSITMRKMHNFNRSSLIVHAFGGSNDQVIWYIKEYSIAHNLLSSALFHLKYKTSKVPNENGFRNMKVEDESIHKKSEIGHAAVFKPIMGNSSFSDYFSVAHSYLSPNIHVVAYLKPFFVFPYYTHDWLNSLCFMGTGFRGISSIPFDEVININDKFV